MTTDNLTTSSRFSLLELPIFKSDLINNNELRVLGTIENPLFIAKDVAIMLEYSNTKKAIIDHIDTEDVITYNQLNESGVPFRYPGKIQPHTKLINESGLYSLILRSKNKKAKLIKRWITSEVIPSIRKTGQYKMEISFQETIEKLQNESQEKDNKIKLMTDENFKLMRKHNSNLQRHQYYKFKKRGPCFYIITQGLEYKDEVSRIKIGICGCAKQQVSSCPHCKEEIQNNEQSESFDSRLKSHRTLWPQLQVKFAVYTCDASLLEKCLKRMYKDAINPGGHEIIENVKLEDVINETNNYLNLFNVYNEEKEYLIEENIEDYNKISETALKLKKEVVNVVEDVIEEVKEEIKEKTDEITKYEEYINNLDKYKVNELQEILKELGLIQKGLKKEKQVRIKQYLEKKIEFFKNDVCNHSDKKILENIEKYTYEQLKKIATKYNLRQIGTCIDLINRIRNFLDQGKIDSKRRKDVFQYDSSGNLVNRWNTITELS